MAPAAKIKKILTRNPKVDKEQFEEAMSLLDALRVKGIKSAQYDLRPPFRRHEGTQHEGEAKHPRTVRLKS